MADAKLAILVTLDPEHEGGFQNDYKDRANWTSGVVGVGTLVGTNGGITALDMPGVDIKNLTTDQKVNYYLENYWKPLYAQIDSQQVAAKLFDMGVLMGVKTAVENLQRALDFTVIDGAFGSVTLAAVNREVPELLLEQFKSELCKHAFSIANANPNEKGFLPDWLRRINL
jgi:lysozyme family protein